MSGFFGVLWRTVVFLASVFLWSTANVWAAQLTGVQDIMTRQSVSMASNHEIRFVTPTGVDSPTDTITLQFTSGFAVSTIDAADILLTHGASTGFEVSEALASAAATGTWGASWSGQTLTFTAPTNTVVGEIAAGQTVIVRIGTAAGGSADRIVNPSSADVYPLHIGGTFGDYGAMIIPINSGDSLSVSATVTPLPTPTPSGGGGAGSGPAPAPPPPPPPPSPPPPPPPPAVGPAPAGPAAGPSGAGTSGSGGSSSGGGGTSAGSGIASSGSGGAISIRNLRVTETGERSVLLTWETDTPTTGVIEFGAGAYAQRVVDEAFARVHAVRLSRLVPSTSYQARVTAQPRGGSSTTANTTFRTADDVTPPANPLELRVVGQDRQVALEWTNPMTEDLAEVIVVAREDRFAAHPNDGRRVYAGALKATIDTGLEEGHEYFYSVFARDQVGNVSTGALAVARTAGRREARAERPEEGGSGFQPPASSPQPQAPSLKPIALSVEWWDGSGSFAFVRLGDGTFEALAGQTVRVVVKEVDGRGFRSLTVRVQQDEYQLAEDAAHQWVTVIQLPAAETIEAVVLAEFEDGARGEERMRLAVRPKSVVRDGDGMALAEAEVRVFERRQGEWVLWDPRRSSQINPAVTADDGHYGFFVAPGSYRVLVRREGSLSVEREVEVRGNVLAFEVTLKRPLQPLVVLQEALKKTREVLQSSAVQAVNQQVVAPLVVAATVANLTTAASSASLLHYAYFIFTQPVLLLGRRKRKQWGVVYNALSKQAVDLAIVRLIEAGTGRAVQTRISDGQGRYSFSVRPGLYRLQVIKGGFVFPTEYLKGDREDGAYGDLYHGEPIEVVHEATLAVNVPLDPPEKLEEPLARVLWRRRGKQVRQAAALIGVVVSAATLVISPAWLTGGLFVLQVGTYALFRRLALPPKPKDWGIVYDTSSQRALKQAVVRIFDTRFHKLLETQVTDAAGKYAFFAGQGVYKVTADKQGYEGYKSGEIDLRKAKEAVVAEKIGMKVKGR